MTSTIDRAVMDAVAKQVLSKLDTTQIATSVVPRLQAELPELMVQVMLDDGMLYDMISEVMYDKKFRNSLSLKLKTALTQALS